MKTSDYRQPRQPIGFAEDGVIRFKENKIISWMLEMGGAGKKFDLNDIAIKRHTGEFSTEDMVQLDQLIGYSVSGFGDLSYVPEEEVVECDGIAATVFKDKHEVDRG
jgi:hypothetical protein